MTDKQIIIDGIDVSFCTHHYNGWSNLHRDTRPMCEIGYDRECEPKHFECSHYVKCLEQQLKTKEQECDELKEDYATAKSMYDLCQSDFMELAKIKDNYKQTLTEIKEIAKPIQENTCFGMYCGAMDEILNIIKKVEDEN